MPLQELLAGKREGRCSTQLHCISVEISVLVLVDPAEDPQAKPDTSV